MVSFTGKKTTLLLKKCIEKLTHSTKFMHKKCQTSNIIVPKPL